MKNTKQKIKEVALELFSQFGFAGGSVRDIGVKAGVRESALYNYFNSKESILEELISDAKNNSSCAELITDDLLELLNKPKIFLEKFSRILFAKWDEEKQKKYLRLILIEQFRGKINDVSVALLIKDILNIWKMIFTEMIKFKYIKKNSPSVLAQEFVYPLFMIRMQCLTGEKTDWELINSGLEEHIEYFWNSIKR